MEDRLAGPGVVHLARVDAQHHVLGVVVVVHQDLVAAHPHVGRDVALLGLADQRVDEQPVADLERGLGQVLVRPVDRVAGLERDDALPAALLERRLGLGRRRVAAHERVLVVRQRVGLDRAGEAAGALGADRGDARVLLVGRAVDLLGLELDVLVEDLLDGEAPELLAVRGGQLDDVADRALEVGRERDRDRPELAGGEAHVAADRLVVGRALEARERREAAVREQLEVAGLTVGERQSRAPSRRYPLMPHSVRSVPAQRPARASSPSPGMEVQGMHPIDG